MLSPPRLLFLSLLLFTSLCSLVKIGAKEVEATNEWTLLGENDTVAAGMHIRMDMTTGEKWVKLPSNDKDDENPYVAAVSATGAVVVQESKQDGSTTSAVDNRESSIEPQYNYDAMYRTLSQLPDDEKERIQLPELPVGASTVSVLTKQEREAFERRMKQIWEQRQEELRQFERENLANLPEILKDRIQRIKEYLQDPITQLQSMNLEEEGEMENQGVVSHIVSVLHDLEFHLTDIDMTRDFHTLGGWPVLASLMLDSVHNIRLEDGNVSEELLGKMYAIQSYAAWAIGTAVKNTAEFMPYSVEEIYVGDDRWNVLGILMKQIPASFDANYSKGALQVRLQRMLYALSSVLRGNRRAQILFTSAKGPDVLATQLEALLQDGSSETVKLAKRLLTLAEDIVTDVTLHESKSEQVDHNIVEAFSTPKWCAATLHALQRGASLVEAGLKTARALGPHCHWKVSELKAILDHIESIYADKEINEHTNEILEVIQTVASTAKA